MTTQGYTSKTGRGQRVSRPLAGLAYWKQHGDEFRSLGAGRYEVPSRSIKGKRHEVNIEHESCSCEDYVRRNPYNTPPDEIRFCAHIFAVTVAVERPAPIPSRERFQFSSDQVIANIERFGA